MTMSYFVYYFRGLYVSTLDGLQVSFEGLDGGDTVSLFRWIIKEDVLTNTVP